MKFVRRLIIYLTIVGLITVFTSRNLLEIFLHLALPLCPIVFVSVLLGIFSIFLFLFYPNAIKNITYTFTHWGMEKTGAKECTRQWSKFIKYHESKKFIFLYIDENNAHVIQKRMFNNSDELENFRFFAKERIGSN